MLITGLFGLVVDQHTVAKVPFFGDTDVRTTSYSLVRVTEGRAELTTCRVDISDDSPGRTIMPVRFLESLPPTPIQVSGSDSFLSLDLGVSNVGWSPTDPGVPLPTKARDPQVLDHERDGRPGATVQLQVPVFGRVSLQIVQRGHMRLHGAWTSDTHASGAVETVLLEQHTLGASVPGFAANPPVTPNDADSGFRLRKLDHPVSCAQLRAVRPDW